MQATKFTQASNFNGNEKFPCDHACIISSMQILPEFNIPMILFMQTIKHANVISSVQDACLEHAVVLVTSKICKKNISTPFPI